MASQRHGGSHVPKSLSQPAPARNPAPLPGSLVILSPGPQGRPIYCTPSLAVRRALMNVVVGSLRRDFPAAAFVDALALYRNYSDWDSRWPAEHERYGAGIVVTRAENLPEGTDPFAGLAGEHVIGLRVAIEVETLVRDGRPVAWHAVVFPASYWLSVCDRHSIVSAGRRYASVLAARNAEALRPIIYSPFVRRCGRERWHAPNPRPRPKAGRSLRKFAGCSERGCWSARSPDARGSRNRTSMTSQPVSVVCRRRVPAATEQLSRERPALRHYRRIISASIRELARSTENRAIHARRFRTQAVRRSSHTRRRFRRTVLKTSERVNFGLKPTRMSCANSTMPVFQLDEVFHYEPITKAA